MLPASINFEPAYIKPKWGLERVKKVCIKS